MQSDLELLTAWRAGDEHAGERLVTRHYSAIERFFINKANDHAADLIQRTFLILTEVQERIDERGDVRRYLFGIARNVLLNHVRSIHRDGERLDFATRTIEDLQPTPNTLLLEHRRSQRLLEALRRIPLELQIVLELYYWEDMTAAQLSTLLEMPQGSVRTKIRMAKEKLALQMARLARTPDLEQTRSNLDSWAREVREHLAGREGAG